MHCRDGKRDGNVRVSHERLWRVVEDSVRRGGMLKVFGRGWREMLEGKGQMCVLRSVLSESRVPYLHRARIKLDEHLSTPPRRCICQKYMFGILHTLCIVVFFHVVNVRR
jgi:hypothetical protein